MSTPANRAPTGTPRRLVAALATAVLAGCGSATTEFNNAERDDIEESSTEALQSANDAANAGATAEGGQQQPGPLAERAAAGAVDASYACRTGSLTDTATQQDANTLVHVLAYSACEVRAGHVWDGNQTVTVTSTGATTRTLTVVNALTETIARGLFQGDHISIATTAPIVIEAVGEKASGSVTRTLVSGTDHRQRESAAGIVEHSVDVTYGGLVLADSYGAVDASGDWPLVTRVANGAQSVHHLLWKVTIGIVHAATTWSPATCSCTPVSGGGAHTFVWDDGSRTLALARNNESCGNWTLTGTDTKNNRKIDEVFIMVCP